LLLFGKNAEAIWIVPLLGLLYEFARHFLDKIERGWGRNFDFIGQTTTLKQLSFFAHHYLKRKIPFGFSR